MEPTTREVILAALTNAANAHHFYEVEIGGPHEDWAPWYADHMAEALEVGDYHLNRSLP
jgi:hypothetical protein